jgi:hypothetical protein
MRATDAAGNGSRTARDAEQAMGESRTYGFGRVSADVKPSPYSPLHRPSQMPGALPAVPATPRARSLRLRRRVLIALAIVVVGALGGIAALVGRAAPQVARVVAPSESIVPAPSDEALRLSRSAIAVQRQAPRPRS